MIGHTQQDYEGFLPRLREIGASMPAELRAELRQAHREHLMCAANDEGQLCCVDYLIGDVA